MAPPSPYHVLLANGKWLDVAQPDPEAFDPDVISLSLSRIPRFCGHLDQEDLVWTVAAHTLVVAHMVSPQARIYALLHDAPEIVISDIPAPVKQLIPGISRIESALLEAICQRFGLPPGGVSECWQEVFDADKRCLEWEMHQFQGGLDEDYRRKEVSPPYPVWWVYTNPEAARAALRVLLEQYFPP